MKCFLIFLDDEKEAALVHKINVEDIKVSETEDVIIKKGKLSIIQHSKPYIYELKLIVPPIDANGKANITMISMYRKQAGIFFGDYIETKKEYLKREKATLAKLIKR